jgi:hypothetical protein
MRSVRAVSAGVLLAASLVLAPSALAKVVGGPGLIVEPKEGEQVAEGSLITGPCKGEIGSQTWTGSEYLGEGINPPECSPIGSGAAGDYGPEDKGERVLGVSTTTCPDYEGGQWTGCYISESKTISFTLVKLDVPLRLSQLRLTKKEFLAAKKGSSIGAGKAGRGTTVKFKQSAPGKVRFKVERVRPGGVDRLPGSFKHAGEEGTNSFRFTGRLNGGTLVPGRYRLVAKGERVPFTILAG